MVKGKGETTKQNGELDKFSSLPPVLDMHECSLKIVFIFLAK